MCYDLGQTWKTHEEREPGFAKDEQQDKDEDQQVELEGAVTIGFGRDG